MTRDEMITNMMEGCLKFERDERKFNGTLCKHYLPVLDENRAELRKNYRDEESLTFFDLNENVWVTIQC